MIEWLVLDDTYFLNGRLLCKCHYQKIFKESVERKKRVPTTQAFPEVWK